MVAGGRVGIRGVGALPRAGYLLALKLNLADNIGNEEVKIGGNSFRV